MMSIWDNHRVTIIVASVLGLAVLMVMIVFLAPWLYALITLVGLLLVIYGEHMSGSRKVQYMGILVAAIGIVGLIVRDVNSLTELGIIIAVVCAILLCFIECSRLRSRSNS